MRHKLNFFFFFGNKENGSGVMEVLDDDSNNLSFYSINKDNCKIEVHTTV